MNIAITRAKEIYDKYGDDLEKALEDLGIQVVDVPLAGRLKELYFDDVIVLKQGLSEPERGAYRAHARSSFSACRQPLCSIEGRLLLGQVSRTSGGDICRLSFDS